MDYYVSTTGHDWNNTGSITSPFKTITRATSVALPGDTVYVRGGVHLFTSQQHVYGANDLLGATKTIQGYPGEEAILDGSQAPANTDFVVAFGNNLVIKNLTIRNSQKHGLSCWGTKNVLVENLKVHGCWACGIRMGHSEAYRAENITLKNCQVTNNVLQNINLTGGFTYDGGWEAAVCAAGSKNITFIGNKVWNNYGEGLNFNRVQIGTIESNEVYDNFSANIYIDKVADVTVRNNLCYTLYNQSFYRFNKPARGILIGRETMSQALLNCVIEGNKITGNCSCIQFSNYAGVSGTSGGMTNFTFRDNLIDTQSNSLNTALVIDNESHSNCLVTGNIFKYLGGSTDSIPKTNGITYSNNWVQKPES